MLERQTVYAIGSAHAMKGADINHPYEVPVQTDLMAHLVRTTGDVSLFIEGLGLDGCRGIKEIMGRLETDPRRLEQLIPKFFAQRDFVMWEQAIKMRALLELKAEGHFIEPVPTEVDQKSRDAALRFTYRNPTEEDFGLLERYAEEVLGDRSLVLAALEKSTGDKDKSFLELVQGMRAHYGDLEMARNIETRGGANNLLMFGKGHPLKGWGERFQLSRLDISGYEGGVVGISGSLPETIRPSLNDFRATEPRALVLTGWVQAK
ncbi:MAG: hypothetical protein AAB383_05240 [Patescibacteria group bacterium]